MCAHDGMKSSSSSKPPVGVRRTRATGTVTYGSRGVSSVSSFTALLRYASSDWAASVYRSLVGRLSCW